VTLSEFHTDLSVPEATTCDGEKEVEQISSLSDVELEGRAGG